MTRSRWQLIITVALLLTLVPIGFAVSDRISAETRIREDRYTLRRESIAGQVEIRQEIYTGVIRVLAYGYASIAVLFGVCVTLATVNRLKYKPRELIWYGERAFNAERERLLTQMMIDAQRRPYNQIQVGDVEALEDMEVK